jgi:hypothetical protein
MMLAGACVLIAPGTPVAAQSGTVTYSATVTNVAPPATSFSGASGGGDGWGVGLTATQLFNVFHHASTLNVNCHNQSDASTCWASFKTITDGSGNNFASSGQPGLYVDQTSGHLFVFATRTSDDTGGVVCIDTTQPAGNADPFCGFTALTPAGQASLASGISNISDPVKVGSKWYAFNYFNGSPTGSEDKLLCFDLSTLAACASQPFAVSTGVATYSDPTFPAPSIASFGNEIVVPATTGSTASFGCFDASLGASCSGSWPVTPGVNPIGEGAPFPLLSATGTLQGFCFPASTDPCYTLAGASTPTPANLAVVIPVNDAWNSPAWTTGPRVYVPNGLTNKVHCFDYSANAACANFPLSFSNLGYLYSVNPDWQRPTCVWVNADYGSAQIQNFDAFTGGVCGSGPTRVLASTAVSPGAQCVPGSWTTLQVTKPTRGLYTSATVQFVDGDGNTIPGTTTMPLDNTGSANLSGLNLNAGNGLPQFLLTFTGASNLTEIDTALTWTGTYDPSCLQQSGSVVSGWTMSGMASPSTTASGNPSQLSVSGLPSGATGTVTFTDSKGDVLCVATVSNGTASCNTSASLPPGTYAVTASYSGDAHDAVASAVLSLSVTIPIPQAGMGSAPQVPLGVLLMAVGGLLLCVRRAMRCKLQTNLDNPSLSGVG